MKISKRIMGLTATRIVAKSAAQNDCRYVFNGIYFSSKYRTAIATDGRRLAASKHAFNFFSPADDQLDKIFAIKQLVTFDEPIYQEIEGQYPDIEPLFTGISGKAKRVTFTVPEWFAKIETYRKIIPQMTVTLDGDILIGSHARGIILDMQYVAIFAGETIDFMIYISEKDDALSTPVIIVPVGDAIPENMDYLNSESEYVAMLMPMRRREGG